MKEQLRPKRSQVIGTDNFPTPPWILPVTKGCTVYTGNSLEWVFSKRWKGDPKPAARFETHRLIGGKSKEHLCSNPGAKGWGWLLYAKGGEWLVCQSDNGRGAIGFETSEYLIQNSDQDSIMCRQILLVYNPFFRRQNSTNGGQWQFAAL